MTIPEEWEQDLFGALALDSLSVPYEALGKQDICAPQLTIHGIPLSQCSEKAKLEALRHMIGAEAVK